MIPRRLDKRRREGGPLQLVGFRADRLVVAQLKLLAKSRRQSAGEFVREALERHVAAILSGVA